MLDRIRQSPVIMRVRSIVGIIFTDQIEHSQGSQPQTAPYRNRLIILDFDRPKGSDKCPIDAYLSTCPILSGVNPGLSLARPLRQPNGEAQTRGLDSIVIADGIIDARKVVFCFGTTLPTPVMLVARPRSIGIAETEIGFTISFLESPMAIANETIASWITGVAKRTAAETLNLHRYSQEAKR